MEKLKRICDTLDGIPDAFKPLYEEGAEGKFVLTQIENHEDTKILATVRAEAAAARVKNRDLTTKLDAFSGLDPEKTRTALAEVEALKEQLELGDGKATEKLNLAVASRLKIELSPLQRKVEELTKANEDITKVNLDLNTKAQKRTIHDAMREACVSTKVTEAAYLGKWPDALRWAEENAIIGEDNRVTEKESGMPLKDVLTAMKNAGEQSHWFGTSSGGGANGNSGTNNQNANPWSAAHWNGTEQGRIFAKDPARATALARSAGVDVNAAFHPSNGMPKHSEY